MKYRFYLLGILIGLSNLATSQQTILSSLYARNYYLINPAEAAMKKGTQINTGYRAQWLGFQGAPTISYLTVQHRLNKSVGLGGYVSMEKMAFIQHLNAEGTFAYTLKVNDDNKVYAGLSLGIKQTNIDLSGVKADDYTDNLLMGGTTKGLLFNAKFGLTYVYKNNLKIGLSFPQLLKSQLQISNTDNGIYDFSRHWNVYASYSIELDKKVNFVPVLMVRNAQMVVHQVDFIGNFELNKKYWVGLGIRQGVGFLVNLGGQINDMIGLSYAYDFTGKSLQGSAGSHEIMLSINFKKKAVDANGEEIEGMEEIPEDKEPTERKKSTRF